MAKIPADVVEALREKLSPLDTEEARQAYRDRRFPRFEETQDLNKRYRWDLFAAARGYDVFPDGSDYADAHIYTALRKLIRPLSCTDDCTVYCGHCKGVR